MSKKVDSRKKQVFEQLFEPENMSKKLISRFWRKRVFLGRLIRV